ncbi:TIGR00730 family Rossman fold protein [Companilactobacillus ginsenosidimutans]|uniref:Cytokinin riboside 5'-monophosphate phosphoribohydrolase n=1 Tax=Companilactobacillus ginsenosidimutans TaxID=1007676 RepID=A0A0H4QYJ9_9LACO|nr:TIGR00730 family Rossman fold protein [Companilactobacillus ginsenosidimutans]AKP66550.1 lysine decarboxylase [Companilactobacillus ginsenosidimutans]
MENIAVYCGASSGNKHIYTDAAVELGHWIVKHGYGLTYGGGRLGLMGTIANTVLDDGGYVHGIITKDLAGRELTHQKINKVDIVDTIDIRKELMLKNSIASIALPGGPGTLEEMSDAFSWTRIGENDNPCIYFNVNHYYDPLLMMYNQMVNDGFLDEKSKNNLLFTNSLENINNYINNYIVPKRRQYKDK